MKQKNKVWKESDILIGMYITKNTSPKKSKNLSFAVTVTYKIGFSYYPEDKKYGLISCLTDGFYTPIANNYQELVDYLNNSDNGGFRKVSMNRYIKLLKNTTHNFNNDTNK